jgi:transcriptional regulator with XRE-family HTH domain
MTQTELAKLAGRSSQQAVSQWLRGLAVPREKTAKALARNFPETEASDWTSNPSRMVKRALDGKIKPRR